MQRNRRISSSADSAFRPSACSSGNSTKSMFRNKTTPQIKVVPSSVTANDHDYFARKVPMWTTNCGISNDPNNLSVLLPNDAKAHHANSQGAKEANGKWPLSPIPSVESELGNAQEDQANFNTDTETLVDGNGHESGGSVMKHGVSNSAFVGDAVDSVTSEQVGDHMSFHPMKKMDALGYDIASHFFENGQHLIDFILVYKKSRFEKAASKDEEKKLLRQQFEANLMEEGLLLEHTKGTDTGLKFVKIHAPWDVLIRYAEVMKLKMPMKQLETSWRLVFDDEDPYSKGKFTAAFSRDKIYLFDIPPQKELFFTASHRSQIVDFILKRKTFSRTVNAASETSSFGLDKLLTDAVYLAAYPLHEGRIMDTSHFNSHYEKDDQEAGTLPKALLSPRMKLVTEWASVSQMFKSQPLDDIREYFGVKIALYFAWLGFYTSMLIPASIVGLLCFFYGWISLQYDQVTHEICSEDFDKIPMCPLCSFNCSFWNMSDSCAYAKVSYLFDNHATIFFAIFMSIWATVYLEMWKRYSARITYRWDLSNFDKYEEYPRPEYLARLSKGEKKRLNIITKMYEPYVPFWRKQLPHTAFSASIVFLLVLVALISVVGVIIYRIALRTLLSKNEKIADYATFITSITAAALNLFCIMIFNLLYSRIAFYLTELEMPRTQTDFDNSLTLKMYLLQFVNYYSSIFYVAFFKGRFVGHPGDMVDDGSVAGRTQEECGIGGCLVELAIQLAIIMVGKQAVNAMMEMSQPCFERIFQRWTLRNQVDTEAETVPQWEEDFFLARWRPHSLFKEYLEMVLQFGFVTIFVAAFPLAPLFALINNALEIRLDAKKMISSYRRPVAQRVKNIGIWYRILDSIGKMCVLTNAVIIAFTSDFIPRILYYSKYGKLEGYLNSTLSAFDITKLKTIYHKPAEIDNYTSKGIHVCMYQGNRNPPTDPHPYEPNYEYWELLAIRLAFVFLFENVIAVITMILRWLIPDVPRTLRQNIRQHAYLTNELIMQQELKRVKEFTRATNGTTAGDGEEDEDENNNNSASDGHGKHHHNETSVNSSLFAEESIVVKE